MPAIMNAANEIAVEQFLNGRIGFLQIGQIIERTMDAHQVHDLNSIAEVLQTDRWGRDMAREICTKLVS